MQNTEKHMALELVTIANIDSKAKIPTRDELLKVKLPVEDLIRWGIVNEHNKTRDVDRIGDLFNDIRILIPKSRGKGYNSFNPFPDVEYFAPTDKDPDGYFHVRILGYFAPQMMEINGHYTAIKLELCLNSISNMWGRRIYNACKNSLWSSSPSTTLKLTVEKFRHIMGLEDEYPLFKLLKFHVIEGGIKAINDAQVDIAVDVEYVRGAGRGRPVKELKFHIRKNKMYQGALAHSSRESEWMSTSDKIWIDGTGFKGADFLGELGEQCSQDPEVFAVALKKVKVLANNEPVQPVKNMAGYFRNNIVKTIPLAIEEHRIFLEKKAQKDRDFQRNQVEYANEEAYKKHLEEMPEARDAWISFTRDQIDKKSLTYDLEIMQLPQRYKTEWMNENRF
jgi:plasmid replication initiation protein